MKKTTVKIGSIFCVLVLVTVAFSTVVTNVLADENGEEKTIESLNPDVATDGYIHVVWQENVSNFEIFYSNSKNGNYKGKLETAISDVGFLVENTKNNDAVKELKKSLGELNTAKTNYYASDFEKSFKNTENAVDHLMEAHAKGADTLKIINYLTFAVRDMVKVNILYLDFTVVSGSEYINESWDYYYMGIVNIENGCYDKAVDYFKDSIKEAVKALDDFNGIDFGEIVRISYTDYDSVNPQIFLNGTINVGWFEEIENETHIFYARSINDGKTWWYFDATQYADVYLSAIGIDPYSVDLGNIFTVTRALDDIRILSRCHYFYTPVVIRDGWRFRIDKTRYSPINDPYLDRYYDWYDWDNPIHIGDIDFYIICKPWPSPPPPPPPQAPDLTVTNISFSNDNPLEGENVTINATVSNIGTASVSGTNVTFYVNSSIIRTETNIVLNMSESKYLSATWKTVRGGHKVTVIADPSNGLPEGDESNNEMSRPLDVFLKSSNVSSGTYAGALIGGPGNTTNPIDTATAIWSVTIPKVTETSKVGTNEPPTCTITYPNGYITLSGNIQITGTAKDLDTYLSDKIEWVKVKIDSGSWQTASGTNIWTYDWNTKTVSNEDHTIYAKSYDGTYESSVASITINVKNLVISSVSPTDYVNTNTPAVSADVSGNGIDIVRAYITTGTPTANQIIDSGWGVSLSGSYPYDGTYSASYTPSLSDGSYNIIIAAKDSIANYAKVTYSLVIDTLDPTNPTGNSSSHSLRSWSGDSTIDISWSGYSDSLSGVYGFSIEWSTSSTTVPDDIVDTTGTSTTSSSLSTSSNWYCHIRTVDRANNWNSGAYHVGPFYIDVSPPNTSALTESHCGSTWTTHTSPRLTWSNPGDTGCGVVSYYNSWIDGTYQGSASSPWEPTITTSGSHYLDVCAVDAVGNSGVAGRVWVYIDIDAPSNPTSYTSSPAVNTWSDDNTIDITWSGASDGPGSGIYGYSYEWSTSSTTIPDDTVNTTGTSATSPVLADSSSWYFHVRTRDNIGFWNSGTYHIGPFKIDTAVPSNPSNYSSSHTVNTWSTDNTIDIAWSGAIDNSGSGIYGYSYEWSTSSTTIPDDTVNTTGTSATSPVLADSSSWYFHVRTRDNVGHWHSGAYHVGPFKIDANPPTSLSITINNGANYTNSTQVTLTLSAYDQYSGLNQMCFSNDNTSWGDWKIFSASMSWNLTSVEGIKTVYFKVRDKLNNTAISVYDTITLDMIPPSLNLIQINNNATYATNRVVNVSVNATDATSFVSHMSFSNDKASWSEWYNYTSYHSWLLSEGDGEKTVNLKIRDAAGNVGLVILNDTIILDLTLPQNPTICTEKNNVQSGVWQKNYSNPSFTWGGASDTNNISYYYYYWGNDPYGTASNYTNGTTFTPSAVSSGIYYLRVATRDMPGNVEKWKTIFIFKYDNSTPTDLSLLINNGAQYTASPNVTLTLSAIDLHSGLTYMMISNNIDFTGASWEPYSASKLWTLSPDDGTKTVYFKVKDLLDNIASRINATITLDISPPQAPKLISPTDNSATSNDTITLSWECVNDSVSGTNAYILEIYQDPKCSLLYRKATLNTTSWRSIFPIPPNVSSTYYWRVRAVDNANNTGIWSEFRSFVRSNRIITVYLSNDGGSTWYQVQNNTEFRFPTLGTNLQYKTVLTDANIGQSQWSFNITLTYGFSSGYLDNDNDGLTNLEEYKNDTNWQDPDTDDDYLLDGEEVKVYGTNATKSDTDGDKLLDGYNVTLNPNISSQAGICTKWIGMGIYYVTQESGNLTFLGELSYGTNATKYKYDTDGDGMWDGWEAFYGTNPTTNDSNEDYDWDNLTNIQEYQNKTNPLKTDTDEDGLNDREEILGGFNPFDPDIDKDGLLDGIDLQPTVSWIDLFSAPSSPTTAYFVIDYPIYQQEVNYYNSLTQQSQTSIASMIDQSILASSMIMPGSQRFTKEFIVYNTKSSLPTENDVLKGITEAYSDSGYHAISASAINNTVNYAGSAGDRNFYTSYFNVTIENYRPFFTPFYHTYYNWTLEPNAKNVISLQFSLDPVADYSYIDVENNTDRKPAVIYTLYKDIGESSHSVANFVFNFSTPANFYEINTYTHDDLIACYQNIAIGSQISAHGYQMEIAVPPKNISSLSAGQQYIIDLTWIWLVASPNKTEILPLNPYHYNKCQMEFQTTHVTLLNSILTFLGLQDKAQIDGTSQAWPYKYNQSANKLDFTGRTTINNTAFNNMAYEQWVAFWNYSYTPTYYGPSFITLKASEPTVSLKVGSITQRVVKDPYILLPRQNITFDKAENDLKALGNVTTLATGFYYPNYRKVFLLNTTDATVSHYSTYKGIANNSIYADEIIIYSEDEDLIYNILGSYNWSGVWSNAVPDTAITKQYMGNSIFSAKTLLLGYPSITQYKGYGDYLNIDGKVPSGYNWSLRPPYAEAVVAKNLTQYSLDLIGINATFYEAAITSNINIDIVAMSLKTLDKFISTTKGVAALAFVKKVTTERSLSDLASLAGKWAYLKTTLTVAGVVVVVALTGWQAMVAIQEGNYLKLGFVLAAGSVALTGVVWGATEMTTIGWFPIYYGTIASIVAGTILATYFSFEAARTDDPYRKEFYYHCAAAAMIDGLICAIWIPIGPVPVPVGVIAEAFAGGITWLLFGRAYSLGEILVTIGCWIIGQKTPEEKLREAVNWLNARLEEHTKKEELAIFIGELGI